MSEVAEIKGISKICALERALRELPQLEVETLHFHAEGMYARVAARPRGALIVGKVHKKEHFYIVTKGSVAVTNGEDAPKIYQAGDVIVSQPGTKRAVMALEDSICMTVHRTDKTDLAEIEDELVEPDALSLYGPGNKLKELR